MRLISVLCLGALLVSSGCLAGPTGHGGPVTVQLNNTANATTTFDVSVVPLPAEANVILSDGRRYDASIGTAGLSTNDPGEQYYAAVHLPDDARPHGQYRLAPGETNTSSIEEVPDEFAVVVVVSRGDRILGWVDSTCPGTLAYVEVAMRPYGTDSAFDCRDGLL